MKLRLGSLLTPVSKTGRARFAAAMIAPSAYMIGAVDLAALLAGRELSEPRGVPRWVLKSRMGEPGGGLMRAPGLIGGYRQEEIYDPCEMLVDSPP